MDMTQIARRRRRAGGATPSLSAQVQAILAGTNGFALDPADFSTMWKEDTKVTQVSANGDTIGAIRTKWGNTQFDFIQATASARPLLGSGKFIVPDGVDDYLGADGSFAALQNAPGYFIAARTDSTVTENNNFLLAISTATATTTRVAWQASTTRLRTQVRRLDVDAVTDNFGTSAIFTGGQTMAFSQDLSVTGNAAKIKDNVDLDTYVLAGAPANSENTASTRMRLLCGLSNTVFQVRPLGRMVVLPFIPSAGQRTTINSWLTEV